MRARHGSGRRPTAGARPRAAARTPAAVATAPVTALVAALALAGSLVPLTAAHATGTDPGSGRSLAERVAAVAPARAECTEVGSRGPSDTPAGDVDPRSQVVALDPATGEVVRVDAGSPASAADLAADVDALPGVVATVNRPYSLAATPSVPVKTDRALLPAVASAAAPDDHDPSAEPRYSRQWGLSWIGLPGAWATSTGAGVTVAVLDTGVDGSHPDLAARVVPGIDLVGGTDGRYDPNGHGTFVAGIVAAALDGTGIVGAAEDANVLPVRVLDEEGSGDTGTVARGITAAVRAGATVLNLSLGGIADDPVLAAAVAQARAAGALVVAAVGNEYASGNPTEYPAAFDGVLGVTAVGPDGSSASFANTGAYVDLAAPGVDVWSDLPRAGIGAGSGTSFATPYVSAVAAIVRSAAPSLTGDQVADLLQRTAQDDAAGDGRDDVFGCGLVRADAALAGLGLMGAAPDSSGPSAPSVQGGPATAGAPVSPAPTVVPAAPQSVSARATRRVVTVRWRRVEGVAGYVIGFRVREDGRWRGWRVASVRSAATAAAWRAVRSASAYRVRVLAVNDVGRGPWSRTVTVRAR